LGSLSPVTAQRVMIVILVIVGLLGIAAGIVYLAEPAKSLPSVLPGHISGSTVHRYRRGIAALVIGAVLLLASVLVARSGRRSLS